MRRLVWDDDAWEDYLYWQKTDKKLLKKINSLVKDCLRSPYEGLGKPEQLKYGLSLKCGREELIMNIG